MFLFFHTDDAELSLNYHTNKENTFDEPSNFHTRPLDAVVTKLQYVQWTAGEYYENILKECYGTLHLSIFIMANCYNFNMNCKLTCALSFMSFFFSFIFYLVYLKFEFRHHDIFDIP